MVNEELDELFAEWKEQMEADGHKGFCADGLIHQKGKEEISWITANRRVVFLLKESWNSDGGDIREWSGTLNEETPHGLFYNRISAWLYGINKATSNAYPPIESAFFPKIQLKALRNYPHALVNIKKQPGESRSYDPDIYNFGVQYKSFLKRQMDILDANIVVCCGPIVFKVANEVLCNNNLIEINDWVYVDSQTKTIYINAFHPTASKKNYQMYDWMMEKLISVL